MDFKIDEKLYRKHHSTYLSGFYEVVSFLEACSLFLKKKGGI